MGPRSRKLAAAGLVLAAGLALAWPLRLADVAPQSNPAVDWTPPQVAATPVNADVAATLSTAELTASPVRLPAVKTASSGASSSTPPERIHVVHEGDRLDRLAQRYLGDESRALEIFDLNREALENPHLLPIGLELRIPPAATAGDP